MDEMKNEDRLVENEAERELAHGELRRTLTLPLVVLYGLGVTIGAGIYVLIGATAARAGMYAPVSFIMASVIMAFSACSFAELTGRLPVSAGEAAYVRSGFKSDLLAVFVGLLVVSAGSISASAICIGSAGYIRYFLDLPETFIVVAVILLMGAIASWGILESVTFAAILTLTEIAALLIIAFSGIIAKPEIIARVPEVFPMTFDINHWSAITSAGLLAFFAFVGFEDLVNVAEEVKEPEKTLPKAIFLTLIISTLIYFLVVTVSVLIVPLDILGASKAPLNDVYTHATGGSPAWISAVAILATLNGVIVQMIMGSRVIYGLSRQKNLPQIFSRVNPVTRTPLMATGLIVFVILVLATSFPLEGLAEMTSRVTLTVFALVNMALFKIKMDNVPAPPGTFVVGKWVPFAGFLISAVFLLSDYF